MQCGACVTALFRFPHTPHLEWLGPGAPRDDKVLSRAEAHELLQNEVVVEEKVDGANLGLSVDENGNILPYNRGSYISLENSHPQFRPLFRWIEPRRELIANAIFPDLVLFGEWCYAVHSIRYDELPDWFLVFDVYDLEQREFWSTSRRNELAGQIGLAKVPELGRGRFDVHGIRQCLGTSKLGSGPAEGLYVRRDEGGRLVSRAKLVRPEFTQSIGEHWSRAPLRTNQLAARYGSRSGRAGPQSPRRTHS